VRGRPGGYRHRREPRGRQDAAELVAVDWQVLPSVTNTEKAAGPGAVQIHEVAPNNVAFNWEIGDAAATDAAFKTAPIVTKKRIINQRLVANAIEPRACVASYQAATEEGRSG
jgi:carbon-monoxide dehydrogenase large subunit